MMRPGGPVLRLDDYRKGAEDPFGDWFAERIERAPNARVPAGALFADFKAWCEDRGIEWIMSQAAFGRALRARHVIRCGRGLGGRIMRRGARLRSRWDEGSPGAGSEEGGVMRQPTWQEIEAEAQRRGRLESDTTGRRWTLAEKIVEVINEGWTPPEPVVDPDVWAFLEWWGSEDGNADPKHAYLAGARMAREQMPSLRDAVEWIAANNDEDLGNDDDGYQIIVDLVAALFDREPNDVVWAVTHQRAGCSWRLGDIRARDPAAPAKKYRGEA
jgi:hypothetical protein